MSKLNYIPIEKFSDNEILSHVSAAYHHDVTRCLDTSTHDFFIKASSLYKRKDLTKMQRNCLLMYMIQHDEYHNG